MKMFLNIKLFLGHKAWPIKFYRDHGDELPSKDKNIFWHSMGPCLSLKPAEELSTSSFLPCLQKDQGLSWVSRKHQAVPASLGLFIPLALWFWLFHFFNTFVHMKYPFYRWCHWVSRAAVSGPRFHSKMGPAGTRGWAPGEHSKKTGGQLSSIPAHGF